MKIPLKPFSSISQLPRARCWRHTTCSQHQHLLPTGTNVNQMSHNHWPQDPPSVKTQPLQSSISILTLSCLDVGRLKLKINLRQSPPNPKRNQGWTTRTIKRARACVITSSPGLQTAYSTDSTASSTRCQRGALLGACSAVSRTISSSSSSCELPLD